VNVWTLGATASLLGFAPLMWVLIRTTRIEALVAVQAAQGLGTLTLLLLAEGFHRSTYFVLPLALSILSFAGTLVFARFLGKHL
jgi:multisubunit Na+/H+ antiporter MnhF subunit